jgi:hypothetical protein
MRTLRLLAAALLAGMLGAAPVHAASIVYEGDAGPGKGKRIVLLASDHDGQPRLFRSFAPKGA